MAEESILSDDLLRQLISVGEVDILVGLPTHNHAKAAGHVAHMIRTGLLKYFPRQRAAILNADIGSRDGTPDVVAAASSGEEGESWTAHSLRTMHCMRADLPGTSGKGVALQTIVAAADLLRAKACAVLTPEAVSMTPEWLDRLVRPVYRDQFDLVTPVYCRRAYDGILITNLLYPVTRALYGKRIREPNPTDFAFSAKLGGFFMGSDTCQQELVKSGAEFCLTAAAVAGGYSVHQSFLGAKERPDTPSTDLVHAMRQVLSSLFWSLDEFYNAWSVSQESQHVSTLGPEYEVTFEPVRVSRKRLYEMFRAGVSDLKPILASILSATTLEELQHTANAEEATGSYSDELWAKTIYEFAASYHRAVISRDHIIQALVPLYRGRVHTFMQQTRAASTQQMEQAIESLCQTFERLKPSLLALWTKQEGGS